MSKRAREVREDGDLLRVLVEVDEDGVQAVQEVVMSKRTEGAPKRDGKGRVRIDGRWVHQMQMGDDGEWHPHPGLDRMEREEVDNREVVERAVRSVKVTGRQRPNRVVPKLSGRRMVELEGGDDDGSNKVRPKQREELEGRPRRDGGRNGR